MPEELRPCTTTTHSSYSQSSAHKRSHPAPSATRESPPAARKSPVGGDEDHMQCKNNTNKPLTEVPLFCPLASTASKSSRRRNHLSASSGTLPQLGFLQTSVGIQVPQTHPPQSDLQVSAPTRGTTHGRLTVLEPGAWAAGT